MIDPSCGSGGFLVSAYHRLEYLNNADSSPAQKHNKILSQIYGIDINQFATHLSVVNLTLRNLKAKTDKVNVFPVDFFKVPALQSSLSEEHERESLQKRTKEFLILNQAFDAVIANPPYTRQDDIGNKDYVEQLRDTALTFYETRKRGKKIKTVETSIKMSKEAGIYAYFFTHSTHFLREKGIMSYIVSNSWLDVKFGKDIQDFFLKNFQVISIIDFDKRVFEDAAVNTVIVLLRKVSGKAKSEERDKNLTKFIRIKSPIGTDELIDIINNADTPIEDASIRLELVPQVSLKETNKWSLHLKAPPIYHKLRSSKKICNLEDIADVSVGYVTLANDFFIISKDQADNLGIEREFLFPALTKARNLKYLDVRAEDSDSFILFIDQPRSKLKDTNTLKYIEASESKDIEITRGSTKGQTVRGFQNTPALKNRNGDWFVLKDNGIRTIIVPVLVWERWYASLNRDDIYVNDTFYWLDPKTKEDYKLLFCYLNSAIVEFLIELMGKSVYGEGVIQIRKYVLKDLPVVKINELSISDKKRLEFVFDNIIESNRLRNDGQVNCYRKEIDDIFFKVLGFNEEDRNQLYKSLTQMRENRRNKVTTEIIVR